MNVKKFSCLEYCSS